MLVPAADLALRFHHTGGREELLQQVIDTIALVDDPVALDEPPAPDPATFVEEQDAEQWVPTLIDPVVTDLQTFDNVGGGPRQFRSLGLGVHLFFGDRALGVPGPDEQVLRTVSPAGAARDREPAQLTAGPRNDCPTPNPEASIADQDARLWWRDGVYAIDAGVVTRPRPGDVTAPFGVVGCQLFIPPAGYVPRSGDASVAQPGAAIVRYGSGATHESFRVGVQDGAGNVQQYTARARAGATTLDELLGGFPDPYGVTLPGLPYPDRITLLGDDGGTRELTDQYEVIQQFLDLLATSRVDQVPPPGGGMTVAVTLEFLNGETPLRLSLDTGDGRLDPFGATAPPELVALVRELLTGAGR